MPEGTWGVEISGNVRTYSADGNREYQRNPDGAGIAVESGSTLQFRLGGLKDYFAGRERIELYISVSTVPVLYQGQLVSRAGGAGITLQLTHLFPMD